MKPTAESIKKALACTLPGSTAHRKMLPLNRVLTAAPSDKNRVKNSSVLLLLFVENDELIACLTKRTTQMKHHPGQIALPGGRIEAGETALETALRETWEEIGVTPDQIEILGTLSDFYVEVSRFQIHPFVGWLRQKPKFIINSGEVEKAILFPLKNFKTHFEEVELETWTGKAKVPCIRFEDEIIWGATAMILSEFADVVSNQGII